MAFKAYHFVRGKNYLQQITKFPQLVKIMPCIKIKGLEASVLGGYHHHPSLSHSLHNDTQKAFRVCSHTIGPQLFQMSLGVSRKLHAVLKWSK